MDTSLEASWHAAWRELALPQPPAAVLAALCARWAEPHRRYHTLQHLRECLGHFERERSQAEHPGEVALALWFHDAVYDTARHDNEAESAAWAVDVLRGAGADDACVARVHALVMATRHDAPARTPDERLLVDIDLAILGADAPRFAEYERQIREEYGFVPEDVFRAKRREVLQAFDARRPIYATASMRARLEETAHANLARSLA